MFHFGAIWQSVSAAVVDSDIAGWKNIKTINYAITITAYKDRSAVNVLLTRAAECLLGSNTFVTC